MELEEDILGIARYRHVRVLLDVTKTLCRYGKMKDKNGRDFKSTLLAKDCLFLFRVWSYGPF